MFINFPNTRYFKVATKPSLSLKAILEFNLRLSDFFSCLVTSKVIGIGHSSPKINAYYLKLNYNLIHP